jgi:hypothetical protein
LLQTSTPGCCAILVLVIALLPALANAQDGAPGAPTDVEAKDHPLDGGDKIDVKWAASSNDGDAGFAGYKVYRSRTDAEIERKIADDRVKLAKRLKTEATNAIMEDLGVEDQADLTAAQRARIKAARAAAAETAEATEMNPTADENVWMFITATKPGELEATIDKLHRGTPYSFRVTAFNIDGSTSPPADTAEVVPTLQWFDGERLWLAIITFVLCGSIVYWINHARQGKPLRVRKIAGLEAVDEAVGRATEMGRSVVFVPGIQDMNDIQTIAGITVLARVAKTAAEYDAKVEVPTCRSLVMTTARETVQAAFLAAGRPDAFNEDLIYYVTDEQFGYVAYLSGMMVREKPAACFYMGSFFAESLILAETGNSIGAIQVAGTAQPAQLPFFVAACDYTLIGEEFFAASAYLSGSPEELGSLKGQDVGKVIVAGFMFVGVGLATIAAVTQSAAIADLVEFIKGTMLT